MEDMIHVSACMSELLAEIQTFWVCSNENVQWVINWAVKNATLTVTVDSFEQQWRTKSEVWLHSTGAIKESRLAVQADQPVVIVNPKYPARYHKLSPFEFTERSPQTQTNHSVNKFHRSRTATAQLSAARTTTVCTKTSTHTHTHK